MSVKIKTTWICLLALAAGIKTFSYFPRAVEKYYSAGFYPLAARLLRLLFGWIPFSVGDLFYLVVAGWLLYGLVSLLGKMIAKKVNGAYFISVFRRILFTVLVVYVLFNLLWGLNYNRRGIADQLQLDVKPYSTPELTGLVEVLVTRMNECDSLSRLQREELGRHRNLFAGAVRSYANLAALDPRFAYHSPSIKPSLFSYLGDYLGFAGYYNPFSGESQVNTTSPLFTQPYTTCHEMGHQLGYAKENEANFAGYLSARSSGDADFRYSVYFDLYLYAARELYTRDSTLVKPFREQLSPSIRKDFRELREFNRKYANPFEPVIRRLYGNYLKANGQPQGIMTYNEVIAWLMAYVRKYGWKSI
jgi:hypothetical protein